jgi:hypothetical protein
MENVSSKFQRNVGTFIPNYTASYPGGQQSPFGAPFVNFVRACMNTMVLCSDV